jgi:ribosomal protein S18 acetylase RimI-like enzyme
MTVPPRIALVGSESAALVHQLTLDAFIEYKGVLEPPTGVLEETVADVERAMSEQEVAIAWVEKAAVGAVRFTIEPDYLYAGRLAVLPAFRRMGIAAELMAFADDRARAHELTAVRVEVRSALPGNIAFFQRLGFIHLETRPHPRLPSATSEVLAKPVAT